MAKELPYFRFTCQEWDTGDISLESDSVKGIFMDICSYYWSQNCSVLYQKLIRKFPKKIQKISLLIQNGLIKRDGELINISFLDEQWAELNEYRRKKAEAGAKGGKRKASNATAQLKQNPSYKDKDKDKDKLSSTKAREPDIYWDSICGLFSFNPQTSSEKSRVGKIVRDLKLKIPDGISVHLHIRMRMNKYRSIYPGASLTPEALLKHWDSLEPEKPRKSQTYSSPNLKPEDIPTSEEKVALKQNFINKVEGK